LDATHTYPMTTTYLQDIIVNLIYRYLLKVCSSNAQFCHSNQLETFVLTWNNINISFSICKSKQYMWQNRWSFYWYTIYRRTISWINYFVWIKYSPTISGHWSKKCHQSRSELVGRNCGSFGIAVEKSNWSKGILIFLRMRRNEVKWVCMKQSPGNDRVAGRDRGIVEGSKQPRGRAVSRP
jgi:hypothetical protein